MRTVKLSIMDFSMLLLVVVIFAFKDYSNISIVIQCFCFLLIVIDVLRKKVISKLILPYFINKVLFISMCFISVIWALTQQTVISISMSLVLRLLTGITIILYINSFERLKKIIKYMIIAGIILCLRMIIQVPIDAWGSERVGNYLAYNPDNSYGATGITYVLGIAAVYVLTSPETIIKSSKLKYLIVTVFSVFSLLSGSKKQVFLLLIPICLMSIFKSKSVIKTLKNLIFSLIISIVIIFAIFQIDILYNSIGVRILSSLSIFFPDIAVETDASTIARQYFLHAAWSVFKNHPLIGIGLDGFKFVNPYEHAWAENNFLELLADLGVIGTVIYYSLHIKILSEIIKKIKYRNNFDIQNFIVIICLITIDFTMVSYASIVLQFYLAVVYATNNLTCSLQHKSLSHKVGG